MSTEFFPLYDNMLIRKDSDEKQTQSGIWIPAAKKSEQLIADVVKVGPGRMMDNGKLNRPCVKAGQRVLIGKYVGHDINIDGEAYQVIRFDDVLGIIQD